MEKYIREPVNTITHLVGALLSIVALVAMVIKVSINSYSGVAVFAIILFGVGMFVLYTASTTYHAIVANERVIYILRKLDHSMIFVLIAGTYAPFCLITLQDSRGWLLFSLIYTAAIAGIVFKMFWFNCPRWISTAIYIAMGWLIVAFFAPLAANLSINGMILLVTGGILYTIGGLIYGAKPNWMKIKYFGHHEIFHIFVLLGSLAHFLSVYLYVI